MAAPEEFAPGAPTRPWQGLLQRNAPWPEGWPQVAEGSYPDLRQLAVDLEAALGPGAVRANEPLDRYTTFRIGGPADLWVTVKSLDTLCLAVDLALRWGVPYRLLGAGSNVLVSDAGVKGLVIVNRARTVTFAEKLVRAESGAALSTLGRLSVERGLGGLEWAVGIPGTVGGAIVCNAGAWGSDVASVLNEAIVLLPDRSQEIWPAGRFQYGYRSSILKQQSADCCKQAIVLDAEFVLRPDDRKRLDALVAEYGARRRASQPSGATCGSVFKNPPGDYAGRLLEAAGVKGLRSGGAAVSRIHANFIVNHGKATAVDVRALIEVMRREVSRQFNVDLELEIDFIGKWLDPPWDRHSETILEKLKRR